MMRLFIALELEPAVRERLSLTQVELRRSLDARWVRWVQPQSIHLTIKFLGEVEAAQVREISSAIEAEAVCHGPSRFTVAGVGAFPNPERARVLWVGLQDPAGSLAGLHTGMEAALGGVGFGREGRAYTPHLTLGRVRDGIGREALAQLAQALSAFPGFEPMVSSSDQVILVRSELRPDGAAYTILSGHTLQGDDR
jgi:RNA 2',3'-cyclic 3'-phosphodiesterase